MGCSTGLIDEGESPEKAAIRELEEETGALTICPHWSAHFDQGISGFKADHVIYSSSVLVTDPGQ